MSETRVYLPVRTFEGSGDTPKLSVWTVTVPNLQAPILLKREGGFLNTVELMFDIERRFEDLDIAVLTPLVCHEKQGMVSNLLSWGFEQVSSPVDDPFCGVCGHMCTFKWEYEDTAGDGPPQWAAEAVSRCCRAAMLADPCGIVEFDPDPNEWGAFDDDGGVD